MGTQYSINNPSGSGSSENITFDTTYIPPAGYISEQKEEEQFDDGTNEEDKCAGSVEEEEELVQVLQGL